MTTSVAPKTIADLAPDTRLVCDRLRKAKVGDVLGYAELGKMIGRNVQGDARYVLQSARHICEREGIIFDVVHSVGVKRLNDVEIVNAADSALPRIRRLSKRAMRKLASVSNYDAMPNASRVRHNVTMSLLGAVSQFATDKAHKKIEKILEGKPEPLSIAGTLEAFR